MPTRRPMPMLIAVVTAVGGMWLGPVALGQGVPAASPPPPAPSSSTPELTNPAVEDAARRLTEPGADQTPIPATGGSGISLPGVTAIDLRPAPTNLVREGAFLSGRQGILRPLRDGRWAMVFDPIEGQASADRPMIMLQCLRLTEMQRLVESTGQIVTFEVSGRVTAYLGNNYLLPTTFTTVSFDAPPEPVMAEGADGEASTTDAETPGVALEDTGDGAGNEPVVDSSAERGDAEPTVEELLAEVDRLTEENARRDPGSPGEGESGGEGTTVEAERETTVNTGLLREGLMVTNRVGRLERSVTGGWALVSDSGAANMEGALAPIKLLPCLNLEAMGALAAGYGDGVRFSVSGTVYVYDGENYLLPRMYLIVLDRSGNLVPGG